MRGKEEVRKSKSRCERVKKEECGIPLRWQLFMNPFLSVGLLPFRCQTSENCQSII